MRHPRALGTTQRITKLRCSISLHGRVGAPKDANRHACIAHKFKGLANVTSKLLVTPFTPNHRLGNTLWRYNSSSISAVLVVLVLFDPLLGL